MMRTIFILIGLLLWVSTANAVTTRSITYLKDLDWSITGMGGTTSDLTNQEVISPGGQLKANVDLDQEAASELAIYIYGGANFFTVSVNGNQLKNELDGEDFHAEILPEPELNELAIELVVQEELSRDELNQLLEYAQISVLNNVFICHIQMTEDPFFGGKMVEADVKNLLNKDVDGKLIANVLDRYKLDLITQNNNCAYARQGSDMLIDINFPDAEVLQKGKEYLLEISMVDKEKNEEIIDQLLVPVRF